MENLIFFTWSIAALASIIWATDFSEKVKGRALLIALVFGFVGSFALAADIIYFGRVVGYG